MTVQLRTPKTTFTVDYPQARAFADAQAKTYWPHMEIKVEKDKQDILVNMTDAERHASITALKLFTNYEIIIGDEFWLEFVYKKFPRAGDIQPMAAMFAAIELQTHAPFYSKINEELGLASDEFYTDYVNDPVLKSRMDFLWKSLGNKDDLRALGAFSFAEGAVLFSSFAYFKHFQSQGKNKALNIVSGINFSIKDEDLHSQAAGWLFSTLLEEEHQAGNIDNNYITQLKLDIQEAGRTVYEHECAIISKFLEKGPIEGFSKEEAKSFAAHRVDVVLGYMGIEPIFNVEHNPIAKWFYSGVEGFSSSDFFNATNNQYVRGWSGEGFTF